MMDATADALYFASYDAVPESLTLSRALDNLSQLRGEKYDVSFAAFDGFISFDAFDRQLFNAPRTYGATSAVTSGLHRVVENGVAKGTGIASGYQFDFTLDLTGDADIFFQAANNDSVSDALNDSMTKGARVRVIVNQFNTPTGQISILPEFREFFAIERSALLDPFALTAMNTSATVTAPARATLAPEGGVGARVETPLPSDSRMLSVAFSRAEERRLDSRIPAIEVESPEVGRRPRVSAASSLRLEPTRMGGVMFFLGERQIDAARDKRTDRPSPAILPASESTNDPSRSMTAPTPGDADAKPPIADINASVTRRDAALLGWLASEPLNGVVLDRVDDIATTTRAQALDRSRKYAGVAAEELSVADTTASMGTTRLSEPVAEVGAVLNAELGKTSLKALIAALAIRAICREKLIASLATVAVRLRSKRAWMSLTPLP